MWLESAVGWSETLMRIKEYAEVRERRHDQRVFAEAGNIDGKPNDPSNHKWQRLC